MTLQYNTRDVKGNDIVKDVTIKEYNSVPVNFCCPVCHNEQDEGIPIKSIVSSSFCDWQNVGSYVCRDCSKLFSLYHNSYIILPGNKIKLLNVREIKDVITQEQLTPFKLVITISQKKHLFYDAPNNENAYSFGVKLERETIFTNLDRMRTLFSFVENLLVLGAYKGQMQEGVIPFDVLKRVGFKALSYLEEELTKSREIQIPLYCGQKLEISEEEAVCNLDSILKA